MFAQNTSSSSARADGRWTERAVVFLEYTYPADRFFDFSALSRHNFDVTSNS